LASSNLASRVVIADVDGDRGSGARPGSWLAKRRRRTVAGRLSPPLPAFVRNLASPVGISRFLWSRYSQNGRGVAVLSVVLSPRQLERRGLGFDGEEVGPALWQAVSGAVWLFGERSKGRGAHGGGGAPEQLRFSAQSGKGRIAKTRAEFVECISISDFCILCVLTCLALVRTEFRKAVSPAGRRNIAAGLGTGACTVPVHIIRYTYHNLAGRRRGL